MKIIIKIKEKIKEYGWKETLKIAVKLMLSKSHFYFSVKLPLFLRFRFYKNILRLMFFSGINRKRILGIWDFKALPWSIGDPLVFIETLSILKLEYNAEAVDIVVVYDKDNPAGNRGIFNAGSVNISPGNAQDYMLDVLPLFGTCPFPGSIYQFNSRDEFCRFLKENMERYKTYPRLGEHLGERFNLWGQPPILNIMQEFFNTYGYLPYLRIGERDSAWAKWVFLNNLPKEAIAVSLSLKQTSHRAGNNADPQTWLPFIDRCKLVYPEVVFIIVGLKKESFDSLRSRPNVIIAKDMGTSVIEDLALIRSSIMYMGTSSGVNMIAMFSDLPYLIFQMETSNYLRHGLTPDEKFSFVLENQNIFSAQESVTPEFLFEEFRKIYSKLNKDVWRALVMDQAKDKQGHPVAKVSKKVENV